MWLLICRVPIWQAGTASNRISCEPLRLFFLSAIAIRIDLRQRPARLRHSNLISFELILKGWEFWLYQHLHPVPRQFEAMFGSSMIRKFELYGPQELGVLRNVVFGGPHRSHVGWLCKQQVPASSLKAGDVGCLFEKIHITHSLISKVVHKILPSSPLSKSCWWERMLLVVLRSSGWSSCFALNHRSVGVRTSERQLVTENSD